jgi:hypothetical protein
LDTCNRDQHIAGIVGLLAIAAGVIQMVIVGSTFVLGASASEVVAFYAANGSANKIGVVISALVGIPLAICMVGIHRTVSAADRAFDASWSTLFLFGIIMMSVTAGFADALFAIATLGEGVDMDPNTLRTLNDGVQIGHATLGVWTAVATGSVAVATFRYRVRSSWYGRLCTLCAVFGVLAVVDAVSISTGGIFANLAFLVGVIVWLAMSSVLMLRES